MTHPFKLGALELERPGRILGVTYIFGVLHHVELIQVRVEDGLQVAVNEDMKESLDRWLTATDPDGHCYTVMVPGHEGEWLAFIHPGS